MSTRATRARGKATAPAAAAAAAASSSSLQADVSMDTEEDKPTAAAAAATGRAGTRRRAAPAAAAAAEDNPESKAEEAEQSGSDSSSSGPAPKRAARASARSGASGSAGRSASPVLTAAAAERKQLLLEHATAALATLDRLRTANVAHLFGGAAAAAGSAASSTAKAAHNKCSALPLALLFSILDFLPVRDIALGAALVSPAAYAGAVEYALVAKTNGMRDDDDEADREASVTDAATAAAVAAASSSSSSSAASAAAASKNVAGAPPHRLGTRMASVSFVTIKALTLLLSSRLRFIVSAIRTDQGSVSTAAQAASSLEAKFVTKMAEALPHLRELRCRMCSGALAPVLVFPPNLRTLSVELEYRIEQKLSKGERAARTSAPLKSWTESQCESFTLAVMDCVAALPWLTYLRFGIAPNMDASPVQPRPGWLDALSRMTRLRTLSFSAAGWQMNGFAHQCSAQLRAIPSLTTIFAVCGGVNIPELLAAPHNLKLRQIPLDQWTLTNMHKDPLLSLRHTLTTLWPNTWLLPGGEIGWVSSFAGQLRSVQFQTFWLNPHPQPQPTSAAAAAAAAAVPVSPSVEAVSAALLSLPLLTEVTIAYPNFNDGHLAGFLAHAKHLARLNLQSKAITTLKAFSGDNTKHLAASLKYLRLLTPTVPRDDVQHLMALSELTLLGIAGSFTEPLFATQLFPFQPPYPKEPLHWLRTFIPRGPNESVPRPAPNLAAVAAAQVLCA